ncbi:hypothetical protein AXG93_2097s1030 [Marchantia polymorpha subsp. ruderalis]|uniref:Uncharacterized protein n=1 Tax=Marchantia polymorpha subsp. ruderalis TaxID=1480154 RepID=A0A176W2W0_MARPO|nr:hypothetical protein AXG93_2097s1030 [Marchantia polymorpha subsp. ruderalis]
MATRALRIEGYASRPPSCLRVGNHLPASENCDDAGFARIGVRVASDGKAPMDTRQDGGRACGSTSGASPMADGVQLAVTPTPERYLPAG